MVGDKGFTLVELVAIILVVAILSVVAIVPFSTSDTQLQLAKNDLQGLLTLAREVAMAHAGNSTVTLLTSASTIDLQVNGTRLAGTAWELPHTLNSQVAISVGAGSLSFNGLGETSAHSFTLTQGSFTTMVNVSGVGYAY